MIQTIEEGFHECHPKKMGISFRHEYNWIVRFSESMLYELPNKYDQFDINKYCGVFFPFGGTTKINGVKHWKYSARFGGRCTDGVLELMAYVHGDQYVTKDTKKIMNVAINKDYKLTLKLIEGKYLFQCENNLQIVQRSHNLVMTWPANFYFGGNAAAPHKMKFNVRKF